MYKPIPETLTYGPPYGWPLKSILGSRFHQKILESTYPDYVTKELYFHQHYSGVAAHVESLGVPYYSRKTQMHIAELKDVLYISVRNPVSVAAGKLPVVDAVINDYKWAAIDNNLCSFLAINGYKYVEIRDIVTLLKSQIKKYLLHGFKLSEHTTFWAKLSKTDVSVGIEGCDGVSYRDDGEYIYLYITDYIDRLPVQAPLSTRFANQLVHLDNAGFKHVSEAKNYVLLKDKRDWTSAHRQIKLDERLWLLPLKRGYFILISRHNPWNMNEQTQFSEIWATFKDVTDKAEADSSLLASCQRIAQAFNGFGVSAKVFHESMAEATAHLLKAKKLKESKLQLEQLDSEIKRAVYYPRSEQRQTRQGVTPLAHVSRLNNIVTIEIPSPADLEAAFDTVTDTLDPVVQPKAPPWNGGRPSTQNLPKVAPTPVSNVKPDPGNIPVRMRTVVLSSHLDFMKFEGPDLEILMRTSDFMIVPALPNVIISCNCHHYRGNKYEIISKRPFTFNEHSLVDDRVEGMLTGVLTLTANTTPDNIPGPYLTHMQTGLIGSIYKINDPDFEIRSKYHEWVKGEAYFLIRKKGSSKMLPRNDTEIMRYYCRMAKMTPDQIIESVTCQGGDLLRNYKNLIYTFAHGTAEFWLSKESEWILFKGKTTAIMFRKDNPPGLFFTARTKGEHVNAYASHMPEYKSFGGYMYDEAIAVVNRHIKDATFCEIYGGTYDANKRFQ